MKKRKQIIKYLQKATKKMLDYFQSSQFKKGNIPSFLSYNFFQSTNIQLNSEKCA